MRSVIAAVSAVSLLIAQMPPGYAQNAPSAAMQLANLNPMQAAVDKAKVSPAIVEAFKAHPKGGELLSKRIADIIVKEPKLAVGLVKHVQTAGLNKAQKQAAEQGLAAALQRLGIKAADMEPRLKAPPPAEEAFEWWWIPLGLLVAAGLICLIFCFDDDDEVTPNGNRNKDSMMRSLLEMPS